MMFGIIDLSTYILGAIVIVLLPGPNSLYVLALAAQHNTRMAYRGAFGIFLGDTILMVLAAAGAASLLQTTPHLFILFKCIGAAYLGWLGIKLLYASWYKTKNPNPPHLSATSTDKRRPFTKALTISLLNPKAILFFISFFIQFVSPHAPYPILSFAVLGLILQIISALYLTLLIFAGVRFAKMIKKNQWLSIGAQSTAGLLFIGFGVKLAMTSLE